MRMKEKKVVKSCLRNLDAISRFKDPRDEFWPLEYFANLLNDPQVGDENERSMVKTFIEGMSNQYPSKLTWTEGGFEPKDQAPPTWVSPSLESPLYFFNRQAKENPIILKFIGVKRKARPVQIYPIAEGSPNRLLGSTLWLLWEDYFTKEGWKRLKRCPQCGGWFVDRTRNKKKERCSSDCTTKFWSWGRRRAEGHKLPIKKRR